MILIYLVLPYYSAGCLCFLLMVLESTRHSFFYVIVHPMQGLRTTQGRGLLNEVALWRLTEKYEKCRVCGYVG